MRAQLYLQIFSLVMLVGILLAHFIASHHANKAFSSIFAMLRDYNERIARIERIYGIYTTDDAQRYDIAMDRVEQVQREFLAEARQQQAKNIQKQQSITCPRCGMTSYSPNDVEAKYCGNCHQFHENMA